MYDEIYNGTNWELTRPIDDANTPWALWDYNTVVGANGNIHIVGRHMTPYNLRYRKYIYAEDIWTDSVRVADNEYGFHYGDIAVDESGFIYAGYLHDDLFYRIKPFCEYSDETTIQAMPEIIIDNTTGEKQQYLDI
jgi:hypothetical protein